MLIAAGKTDAALIQAKSPANCDAHLAESIFQTRSNKYSIKNRRHRKPQLSGDSTKDSNIK